MRREDLAHVLRAASRIVPDADMLVIGSQAVHGGFDSSALPDLTTLSREVDIAFWDDPDNARADRLDAALVSSPHSMRPSGTTPKACRSPRQYYPLGGVNA